jgi:hypothetical protein
VGEGLEERDEILGCVNTKRCICEGTFEKGAEGVKCGWVIAVGTEHSAACIEVATTWNVAADDALYETSVHDVVPGFPTHCNSMITMSVQRAYGV